MCVWSGEGVSDSEIFSVVLSKLTVYSLAVVGVMVCGCLNPDLGKVNIWDGWRVRVL